MNAPAESAPASSGTNRPRNRSRPRLKEYLSLLKSTASSWMDHKAPQLGAALAFYTIFAITPLFIIVLAIAGFVFGEDAARRQLFGQFHSLLGEQGGQALEAVIAAVSRHESGARATVIALATLFIGATGVFAQLQDSLNTVWNLRRKPGKSLRGFIRVRLLSFAMVLAIGFLLLVSLVINAVLAAAYAWMSEALPGQEFVLQAVNFLVSIGAVTLLFAMMFKVLPDASIGWRDVWVGALITAVLFNVGKLLLGLYLGRSTVASVYGAAGSLVVILMWVYYSSQIFLFGAEFTRLYAIRSGSDVHAEEGVQFVTVKEAKAPSA
jgi:membrane protein